MIDRTDLQDAKLLAPLSEESLERLAAVSEKRVFQENALIFREKEEAEYMYFLKEGHVAIEIEIGSNQRALVLTISAGECCGWSALVPPGRMTASAVAVERSTVILVPGGAILECFEREPKAGLQVMAELARMIALRLKDTRLQLLNLMHWPEGS